MRFLTFTDGLSLSLLPTFWLAPVSVWRDMIKLSRRGVATARVERSRRPPDKYQINARYGRRGNARGDNAGQRAPARGACVALRERLEKKYVWRKVCLHSVFSLTSFSFLFLFAL